MLDFDEGLLNGPKGFDEQSIDPATIFDIALEQHYNAICVHVGLAEKYHLGAYREVPLIIKLNNRGLPQLSSVEHAVRLNAAGIGYTLCGEQQYGELARICEQAHQYQIPVITWLHTRHDVDAQARSARAALELGADFVIVRYTGDTQGLSWIERCAGKARVLTEHEEHDAHHFLRGVAEAMSTKVSGCVIGGLAWRHDDPAAMARAVKELVHRRREYRDVAPLV